jgi:hypothetical protein
VISKPADVVQGMLDFLVLALTTEIVRWERLSSAMLLIVNPV